MVTETYLFIEVLFTRMCMFVNTHGTVHLRSVMSVFVKYTLKKKKKSHPGVSNKDRSAESKAEDEPASSFMTFHSGSAQSRGQSALVHTEESRTELEGLISKEQLCPFLSLEMRKIIPGPPCEICFCSDSVQIPDYLTPLGDSRLS